MRIGVDTGFLIGIYDPLDQHHESSIRHFEALFGEKSTGHVLVAPWPILYECCNTKQAKDRRKTERLIQHWNYLRQEDRLILLDDQPFREDCLDLHFTLSNRPLSLVDRVLRAVIEHKDKPIDYFLTYNAGDFSDACQRSGTRLIDEETLATSYGL